MVVVQDILPTAAKVEDLKGWTRKQLFPGMTESDAAFWDDLFPPMLSTPCSTRPSAP